MTEKELFKTIYQVTKKTSMPAYVVGGYIRDRLLESEKRKAKSEKDIDIVIDGSGIAFAKAFDEEVKQAGRLIEFADFDTARYLLEELEIEFAGARSESYRSDSRKPNVVPATIEADLGRRDFTVNAMAREVKARSLGQLIDPFSGEKDIKESILRTPLAPDETFFDDPLRMLRAARFAAQLNFSIERETLAGMERNAERLKIISAERIKEELFKLLATPVPSIGLWILYGTKLLDQFLPEVSLLSGVEEAFGYSHKDNLSHTFAVVDNIATRSDKIILRYAGLMHDIAKPQTKKFIRGRGWTFDMHEHLGKKIAIDIGRRLRFSTDESKYVAKLIRWHLQPIALMDDGITDSAVRRLIVTLGDDLQDLLILCRSDITTGNQRKKAHRLQNYERLDKRIVEVIEKDKLRAFQSPVRGEE
ncbi:MAG: HD domain-containing protein, partial [Patescibacteria group bacterium]